MLEQREREREIGRERAQKLSRRNLVWRPFKVISFNSRRANPVDEEKSEDLHKTNPDNPQVKYGLLKCGPNWDLNVWKGAFL